MELKQIKMKKILSLALLLSSMSFVIMAQEVSEKGHDDHTGHDKKEMMQKSAEEIAQMRTDRLDKEVKLTASQRKQVYALNLKDAKALKIEMEARQKESDANRLAKKESKDQLFKILTPEQQKIIAEKFDLHNDGKPYFKREEMKKKSKDGKRTLSNKVGSTVN